MRFNTTVVNGRETYWNLMGKRVLYWCRSHKDWRIVDKLENAYRCEGMAASSPPKKDIRDPSLRKGWKEWDGFQWLNRPNAGKAGSPQEESQKRPVRRRLITRVPPQPPSHSLRSRTQDARAESSGSGAESHEGEDSVGRLVKKENHTDDQKEDTGSSWMSGSLDMPTFDEVPSELNKAVTEVGEALTGGH
jgi:hypothetical protein